MDLKWIPLKRVDIAVYSIHSVDLTRDAIKTLGI